MKLKKMIAIFIAGCVLGSYNLAQAPEHENVIAASNKSRVSVHDPSVFKDKDGTYYVFGSHIDAAKSKDLQNWTRFTNGYARYNNAEFGDLSANLSKAFAWAGEDLEDCEGGFSVWAPDVIYNPDYINTDGSKGAYLMYFCTSSTYMRSVIAFAAAKKAEGPYEFVDTLIYSGFTRNDSYATSATKNVNRKYTSTNIDELIASGDVTFNNEWFNNNNFNNYQFPNAIDPTIYYDTDGKMYMVYGSWSGGIFTIEMDPETGKCIHPESGKTTDGRIIDSYFGTKISGGCYKSGEGPFIEYNPDTGYYYLWVTYGGLAAKGGYNMRVFRSETPTGPFYDAAGKKAILDPNTNLDSVGLKVMGNYKFSSLDTAYMACGHNSVLRDDDGKWYLLYHARFNRGNEYHEVRVNSMYFNSDGWPVAAPYEYSGDEIAEYGYRNEDIIGEYEYINHGNDTSAVIHEYSTIELKNDGTISGAVTGTWKQANDSAAAEILIDGQWYNGYFIATEDEDGKEVMSFTAVGSNNQTVWGVKTTEFSGINRDNAGLIDYSNEKCQIVYTPETAGDISISKNIGNTDVLSGVSYFISSKNSGLLLDLPDGKLDNGTNIQQWEKNSSFAQQWRIISEDNGYCRIVSLGDESKCIAVSEISADNGVNVELQEYSGQSNQLWKLVKNGDYYGIVSKCSDDTAGLDVYDFSVENGGNINQWNYWGGDCQLWKIEPVYPVIVNGKYNIRSLAGNETLEWSIIKADDGTYSLNNGSYVGLKAICNKDGSYSFVTDSDNNVLEMNGSNFEITKFTGSESQKFILEPANSAKTVKGDVNADGQFNIADLVMMQKFLLGAGNLNDWRVGDLCTDERIDSFDMILMRRSLISVF